MDCTHTTAYTVTLRMHLGKAESLPRCRDCHTYMQWKDVPGEARSRIQIHKEQVASVHPAFKEQDHVAIEVQYIEPVNRSLHPPGGLTPPLV